MSQMPQSAYTASDYVREHVKKPKRLPIAIEQHAFNAGFRAAIDAMNAESDRRDRRAGDPK
jgi:hypothetical protein